MLNEASALRLHSLVVIFQNLLEKVHLSLKVPYIAIQIWEEMPKILVKKQLLNPIFKTLELSSNENLKEGHSIRQDRKIGVASVSHTEG